MKNLIYLIVLSVFIFSCSSDDDNSSSESLEELIKGEWTLLDRDPDGIEVCELGTEYNFKENGILQIHFSYGDDLDYCETFDVTVSWEYVDQTSVKIESPENNEFVNIEAEIYGRDKNRLKLIRN